MPKKTPRPPDDDSAAMAATAPRRPARPAATKTSAVAPTPEDTAKLWDNRLIRASKAYDEWEKEYDCPKLDRYYRGKHWSGLAEDEAQKKYVINMIFATVETQLPSLFFSRPKVKAEARETHETTANSGAGARATLIEHALQTFIDDPKVHFTFETTLALRDAYSRFSLVEVGYTADWIDNPNADKPVLKDDDSPLLDAAQQPILHPKKLPKKESLFVKRLRPGNFRAYPGRNLLESNDWVAYAEWHPLEDVKKNPDYQYTEDLAATGQLKSGADGDNASGDPERDKHVGQVRVWRIWDLRQKLRHVHAEGGKRLLQENKPFATLPIAVLKFYELADSFYPLPPMFNWISPQDEINESREMQKIHRRRAVRRYMREPSVKKAEFEKLEAGEDMTCIEVPKTNPPPIVPIADAPLDAGNWTELAATRDDFTIITGTSGEARGMPEAPTATQANIVNVRAELRESRARAQVADWLGQIARLILIAIRGMQLPMMVKREMDPFSYQTDPAQTERTAGAWQRVKAEDLDTLDVDVKVDVASLSPIAEEARAGRFFNMVAQLTNPQFLNVIMTPLPEAPTEPSPLCRLFCRYSDFKSEQEIREVWRVGQVLRAQLAMMTMAQMAMKGGGAGAPGMSLPDLNSIGGAMPPVPGQATGRPAPGPTAVQ